MNCESLRNSLISNHRHTDTGKAGQGTFVYTVGLYTCSEVQVGNGKEGMSIITDICVSMFTVILWKGDVQCLLTCTLYMSYSYFIYFIDITCFTIVHLLSISKH